MSEEHTTAVVQRYLDELAGDSPAEPIVRALLDRGVRRLHLLCATLLHRSYPSADLSAVVILSVAGLHPAAIHSATPQAPGC